MSKRLLGLLDLSLLVVLSKEKLVLRRMLQRVLLVLLAMDKVKNMLRGNSLMVINLPPMPLLPVL